MTGVSISIPHFKEKPREMSFNCVALSPLSLSVNQATNDVCFLYRAATDKLQYTAFPWGAVLEVRRCFPGEPRVIENVTDLPEHIHMTPFTTAILKLLSGSYMVGHSREPVRSREASRTTQGVGDKWECQFTWFKSRAIDFMSNPWQVMVMAVIKKSPFFGRKNS